MSSELYHAWLKKGEQSENHKYIRREWKNGRWVYYYDSDTSAKPNNTITRISKTNGLLDSKTTINTGTKKIVSLNEGKLSRARKAAKKKVYDTRTSNVVDGKNWLDHQRTIRMNGTVISKTTVRGKLSRSVVAGKEYVRYLLNED